MEWYLIYSMFLIEKLEEKVMLKATAYINYDNYISITLL